MPQWDKTLLQRVILHCRTIGEQPTIDCLDAPAVVVWELEVFGIKPLIKGGHDGRGVIGVLQTQSVTQLMDSHQENIIAFREMVKYDRVSFHSSRIYILGSTLLPLTPLVHVPGGPRLGQVKVRVAPDAVSGEVGVSQEAALAVERRAVAVEALGEGQHDVCELVDLVPDLAVGNLPEGDRDRALPHLESPSDGFIRGSFADLRGVVLYAVTRNYRMAG